MKDKKRVNTLIDLAIEVAAKAHENQLRKGTDIPYITHPLAVGIILAKAGCSDDVIIAGTGRGRAYTLSAKVYQHAGQKAAYIRQAGFDRFQQEQMVLAYIRAYSTSERRGGHDSVNGIINGYFSYRRTAIQRIYE